MTFEEALAAWLPGQRWFAGKDAAITSLAITEDITLVQGDPGLRHLIVSVSQGSSGPGGRGAGGSTTDRYQVFAGVRHQLPGWLQHAVIGPDGHGNLAYDGLHDPA